MKLGSSTATLAAALLMTTGCARPERAPSAAATHPDSETTAAAPPGSPSGPAPRLLGAGDTFDLRVAGGISAGSVETYAVDCAVRPPLAEVLVVVDSVHYTIERVVDLGCGDTRALDTQWVEGTYQLSRDTVQFYQGGGNEVEPGYRAVLGSDLMEVIGGSPQGRLAFELRNAGPGAPMDGWDMMSGTFSHLVGEGPRGDTNWIALVRHRGRDAVVLFGYNLGRDTTDRTVPSVVVESVSVRLEHNEMPYDNCGLKAGGEWRSILALVNRGPEPPAPRLAWRPSRERGRLIPVPADSVFCASEGE